MSITITLTPDFGTRDGFVGAMKGRILELCATATVVDISHDIPPQDIRAGAWCLARATPCYPAGTIHVAVVDPGVGSARQALLIQANRQWYIGPDNGLFGEVLVRYPTTARYRLHPHTPWWQAHPSFDGLALFSPAAACLARGEALARLAEPIDTVVTLVRPEVRATDKGLVGEILLFDRFGNAITNLGGAALAGLGELVRIVCRGKEFRRVAHYAEAGAQQAAAIVNSDGLLELSLYCQSAREALGLAEGDPVEVFRDQGAD